MSSGSGVVSLGWFVKVGAVVVGLSHKSSVSSPTMLLLRGLVSESESLLYL